VAWEEAKKAEREGRQEVAVARSQGEREAAAALRELRERNTSLSARLHAEQESVLTWRAQARAVKAALGFLLGRSSTEDGGGEGDVTGSGVSGNPGGSHRCSDGSSSSSSSEGVALPTGGASDATEKPQPHPTGGGSTVDDGEEGEEGEESQDDEDGPLYEFNVESLLEAELSQSLTSLRWVAKLLRECDDCGASGRLDGAAVKLLQRAQAMEAEAAAAKQRVESARAAAKRNGSNGGSPLPLGARLRARLQQERQHQQQEPQLQPQHEQPQQQLQANDDIEPEEVLMI
jgi:hypothetical protein